MPSLNPGASKKAEVLANLKQRFLQAVSGSIVLKVFSSLAKLAATVVLTKILGAEGFGVFAYAMSLIAISAIPFRQGLPNLVARNIAVYLSHKNWSAMRGMLLQGNQLVLGLSILIILISSAITLSLDTSQISRYTFLVALAILPCIALSGIRRGALIGLHRPVLAQVPEQVIQPALFITLLGVYLLFVNKSEFTPVVAMTMQVITVIIEFVVGYFLLIRFLPKQISRSRATFETSGWLRGAIAFTLIGGMGTINSEIGIIMLGMFGSIEDVGVYKGVIVLGVLVTFILQSINTALLPLVAKLHAEGDRARLQQIVTLACRLVVLFGFPVTLILIFFGEQCLQILYGDEFLRGATALAVLCVGLLLNAAIGPVGLLLSASGYEMDTIKGKSVGVVLNIVLCAFFIPRWGLEGAAWAATCSLLTWNLILFVLVQKRLNIHPTIFGKIN